MGYPVAPSHVGSPSLAVAINCFKLRRHPFEVGIDSADGVKNILAAVWNQLQEAFDEAWESDEGQGGLDPGAPEESWARRLAEQIVGMPYNSPGQVYLNDNTRDRHILPWAQNDADPAYPIVTACQQLVDLAVMFAGFTIDNGGPTFGFNQDGSQQSPLSKLTIGQESTPGQWDAAGGSLQRVQNALTKYPDCGPLAMYSFSDPVAGPGKGAAHIGAALRVNPDRARFQFIDTGGMNSPEPEQPTPKFGHGQCGNYDYHWTSVASGPKKTQCDGMGVIPKPSFDKALPTGMLRLGRARPLGFARFVLGIPGTPNRVLFATRLLPMHVPDRPTLNFSIARYIWSLRYMPNRNNAVGYWVLYVPRGALAEEMLDPPRPAHQPAPDPARAAGRAFTVDEIVQRRFARANAKPPSILDPQDSLAAIIYHTSPDLELANGKWQAGTTHDQGIVRALVGWNKMKTIGSQYAWLTNLPWRTRSGEIQLADTDFADFPYLAGEWRG